MAINDLGLLPHRGRRRTAYRTLTFFGDVAARFVRAWLALCDTVALVCFAKTVRSMSHVAFRSCRSSVSKSVRSSPNCGVRATGSFVILREVER